MSTNSKLEKIPSSLKGHKHWQYGTGRQASPDRRITGSTVLTAISDNGNPVKVTRLVLKGSSQWVIGRNVTRKANKEHLERNSLAFFVDRNMDYIYMVDHEFLSYILLDSFIANRNDASTLSYLSAVTAHNMPWEVVRKVIDRVHRHVCGHATLTDYKLFLERKGF